MENRFIYQKKDFVNCGVPGGSFSRLIKVLEIDNSDYMCQKLLPNGIKAKFFTEEAMQIVLNHLKTKQESKNKNELLLLTQNTELKQQNQQLQNQITMLMAKYTEETKNKDVEIATLQKDNEWYDKECKRLHGTIIKLRGRTFFQRLFNKEVE